jgi:trimeric autotransporter adhesin
MMRRGLFRFCMLLVLFGAGTSARAAPIVYGINNTASAIIRIDAATSVSTVVYTGAPFPLGTRSAALAQCTNGLLYFISGGNNGTLYRFNPYTPAIAPVAIGPTGAPDFIRLSCRPGTEVLYGMGTSPATIYTLNPGTGTATGTALTLPGTTPPASGSGDIGFHPTLPGNPLYFVGETVNGDASTERLWTINLATNTIVNVGAITGLPAVVNGIEFDSTGAVRLSLTSQTRLYAVPIAGGAATAIGASGSMPAVADLGGKDFVPNPDLSITKSDGRTGMSAGGALTYTIVVTNSSTYTVTGTVTDTIPATMTGVNWTCAASAGSTCGAASGSGNAINTTATLVVAGTATYTVTGTLSAGASGTLTNTATVGLPFAFLVDATPGNNSATDNTTINQNPGIAKAFAPATISVNGISILTFTLSNPNATALTGINFTDTYPAAVVNATPLTVGGTCAGVTHTATAGGATFDVTAGAIPGGAPGTCTITVQVTSGAVGIYNNATSGVLTGQTSTAGAPSNTATLTVGAALTLVKSSAAFSDPFNGTTNPKRIPGGFVTYTIVAGTPVTPAVDANTVFVFDAVPANTDLFVGDLGGPGSGPVAFNALTSGLTYTFTSLASATDDVSFSSDGGATYTYTPTPNANGVDPAVTNIRINPKGTFSAASSFQAVFRVRVE